MGSSVLCNLLIPYFQVYSFEILPVATGAIGLVSEIQEQNVHLQNVLTLFSKEILASYVCIDPKFRSHPFPSFSL